MDFSNVLTDSFTIFLLAVLLLSTLTLSLYYGLVYLRVGRNKDTRTPLPDAVPDNAWPSVSVVIVAHNESEFLKESLPYLLEQEYPDYEVVVVDYTSQDDTPFVLRVCAENYPHLKPVNFPEDVNMFRGKKYPLSIGIKSATKDVILLTEPDCIPRSFDWIRHMMCGYMHGASIVMGYSLLKENNTLLNAFERYDNMMFSASYIGMAMIGNPYTATGRNLSYRRDFFFNKGGFISHYTIPDGADDLFVNQNANKANATVVLRDDAYVEADARATFAQWHLDRLHRYGTRRYYGFKDKCMLLIYPVSQILFWVSLLLLVFNSLFPWQLLLCWLVLKMGWQIVTCSVLAKRLKVKKVQYFSPIFELYFLFANTILHLLTLRKKNIRWR